MYFIFETSSNAFDKKLFYFCCVYPAVIDVLNNRDCKALACATGANFETFTASPNVDVKAKKRGKQPNLLSMDPMVLKAIFNFLKIHEKTKWPGALITNDILQGWRIN